MPASVSGSQGLEFSASIDVTEFKKSIDQLKIQVESVEASAKRTKDPLRIVEYNRKAIELKGEIEKMQRAGTKGYDELGNAIRKPQGQLEKLIALQKLYTNSISTATNPELISKYNRRLQETEIQINRTRNIGKAGFDSIGDAVKRNTGLLGGLWGSLRTVANILPGVGIAGLLAFAINPIWDYIKGLDLLKKKTNEATEAKKRFSDLTLSGNQNAQTEITTLRTLYAITQDTTISLVKRKAAVDQLQRDYPKYLGNIKDEEILAGNASGAYDKLSASILATARARAAQELITENSKKQLELERQLVETQVKELTLFEKRTKLEKQAKAAQNTSAREGIRQDVESVTVANEQAIKENQKQQAKLTADRNKLEQENLKLAKNINLEVKNGADLTTNETTKKKESLQLENKRLALLKRINALNDEFALKPMQTTESEIQAIRNKFKVLDSEVKAFNQKNPKQKIGPETLQKLDKTKQALIDELGYQEQTNLLKIELEKREHLLTDFENFRDTFGEARARDRYGKELEMAKEAASRAKAELEKLNAIPAKDLTRGQFNRKEDLTAREEKEEKANEAKYIKLLSSLQDFEQKRMVLTETYNRDREALIAAGDLNEVAALEAKHRKELDAIKDAAAEQEAAFKALFEGVDKLSTKAGKAVVEIAQAKLKDLVAQGKISKQYAKQIQDTLDNTSTNLKQRLPQQLGALASQLGNLAQSVGGVDSAFGKVLQTTAGVIGNVAAIQTNLQAIAKLKDGGGGIESILGGITGGIGAIGAFFTIVKGIDSLFDKSEEYALKERMNQERMQAQEEARIKQLQGMTELLDRQLAAVKDIYGVKRLTEYRRVLTQVTAEYQKQLPELERTLKRFGGSRTGPDTSELIASLRDINNNSLALEKLRQILATMDPADEAAAQINAILSVAETYRETFNAIRAEATGTSFESLTDEIVELFARGNAALEDFGENFTKIMQKSILNSFKRSALEKELQKFYEDFAALAESGGSVDKAEIALLREQYDKIINDAAKKFKELEQVTGVTFGAESAGADSQRGLAGAIKGITADQADILAGQFGGLRLHTAEILKEIKAGREERVDYMALGVQKLRQLEKIEVNTRLTKEELIQTNRRLADQSGQLSDINTTLKATQAAIAANGG